MIKLALSDLDDSLIRVGLPHATHRALAAIHRMLDAGLRFGPSTGRVPWDLHLLFAEDSACYRTGVGISLAANKVDGIRACVCSEPYTAALSKRHNDANIIAFGARVVGDEMAKLIVDSWLDATYEGGRHQRRVDMITAIERGEEL